MDDYDEINLDDVDLEIDDVETDGAKAKQKKKDDWHLTKSDIRKLISMIDAELARRKKKKEGKSMEPVDDDMTLSELQEALFESCPSRAGHSKGAWMSLTSKWVKRPSTRTVTLSGYRRRLVMIGTKMGMKFGKSFDEHLAIKRVGETADAHLIGGYGMIWGNPEQRDLSGEFFTPKTLDLDDIPIKVITFEHDKEVGPEGEPIRSTLGHTMFERDDAVGRWLEAQVYKRKKYAEYLMTLVDADVLNFSSETAMHWREVADDGEIKRWRTAGYSLTTHPMEPRLTDVQRLESAYKSMDLEFPSADEGGDDAGASCLEAAKVKTRVELLLTQIEEEAGG